MRERGRRSIEIAVLLVLPVSMALSGHSRAGIARASDQPASPDLRPLIEWVTRDGHTHYRDGRRIVIPQRVTELLKLGSTTLPVRQRGFVSDHRPDSAMSMNIIDIPGRRELVLTRLDGPRVVFWHTTPDAHVLALVHALNPGEPLTEVPTAIYRELFRESVEYMLQRVPRP